MLVAILLCATHCHANEPKDVALLADMARTQFYTADPYAVRRSGDGYDFVFLARPEQVSDTPSETGRVVCAHRGGHGDITISWVYSLPSEAAHVLYWPTEESGATVFVVLYGSSCILIRDNGGGQTVTLKVFHYDDGQFPLLREGTFGLIFGQSRTTLLYPGDNLYLSLLALDSEHDNPVEYWKSSQRGVTRYLAVGDLEGNGGSEIVSTDYPYNPAKRLWGDVTLRVWRPDGSGYKQVYTSAPFTGHWPVAGFPFHIAGQREPLILTRECPLPKADTLAYLYRWDGKTLQTVAGTRGVLGDALSDFTAADLEGTGTDLVAAFHWDTAPKPKFKRLTLLRLAGEKFVPAWESPPLTLVARLGRPFLDRGQTVLPLLLGDNDKMQVGLVRRQGGKYVGWEKMVYHPAPPVVTPPVPLADRLSIIPFMMEDPMPLYLVLDGQRLIRLFPTKASPNRQVFSDQVRAKILGYAARHVPPSSVTSQVVTVHDDIEGEATHAEVRVGKEVFLSLTPEDAKAYGGSLSEGIARWRDAVRQALVALEKPPKAP